ncbi:MAG: biotin/lipoyl-containing protein [Candidatus Sumerlaeia bacterium]
MKLRVTVNGQSYDVDVEVLEEAGAQPGRPAPAVTQPAPVAAPAPRPVVAAPAPAAVAPAGAKVQNSPIPGTVVEVIAKPGQAVKRDETLMIIDAMKMNTQIKSSYDGTVKEILVAAGAPVKMGQPLVTFE